MSKRSKILELLGQEDLTTKEIHDKTGYDMALIWQYIHQFKDEGKIEKIGNKGRFNIYRAIEKEPQKQANLDTQILKKMIPKFIEYGINLDTTTEIEDKRLEVLIETCL